MTKKALLIIDVQYDFLPGGSLAVDEGDKVIPLINKLRNEKQWDLIVLSRDFHPAGHHSFSSSKVWSDKKDIKGNNIVAGQVNVVNVTGTEEFLWPDHCVQNSHGSEFHADLKVAPTDVIVKKGTNPQVDSYSAFADNNKDAITELYSVLDSHGITDVYVTGIATDFCVYFTCLDARVRRDDPNKKPYNTFLVLDATRGVDKERSKKVAGELEKDFAVKVCSTEQVVSGKV